MPQHDIPLQPGETAVTAALRDERRFWDKVLIGDGCWEWQASLRNDRGYGKFSLGGRNVMAHRVAWELWNGPIPPGLYVLHRCDNRRCVRPDHLFVGTHTENMRDAVAKQRSRRFKISHCVHGHEYTVENTRWYRGQRVCIACARQRSRVYMAKWRARRKNSA